jgi:hypothetical protein
MTTPLRHLCRKCRTKLSEPTNNPRRAFCCRGCFNQHYRRRCIVCEGLLNRKREKQRTCIDVKCRAAIRRFPEAYSWPERQKTGYPTSDSIKASETPNFIGSKRPITGDQPYRQRAGPSLLPRAFALATLPIDPATQARVAKGNRQNVLIGPKDAPVNVLGGYRFPNAPKVRF